MKWKIGVALVAALGLVTGIGLGLWSSLDGNTTSDIVLGTFQVRTADAAATPRLSEPMAADAAKEAARAAIGDTITGLAEVGGRSLAAEDLEVADRVFAPGAIEIRSTISQFRFAMTPPSDLWVFIYRKNGVAMPDWGITDGVVELQVVINDKTGEIEAANVTRMNPNAK